MAWYGGCKRSCGARSQHCGPAREDAAHAAYVAPAAESLATRWWTFPTNEISAAHPFKGGVLLPHHYDSLLTNALVAASSLILMLTHPHLSVAPRRLEVCGEIRGQ